MSNPISSKTYTNISVIQKTKSKSFSWFRSLNWGLNWNTKVLVEVHAKVEIDSLCTTDFGSVQLKKLTVGHKWSKCDYWKKKFSLFLITQFSLNYLMLSITHKIFSIISIKSQLQFNFYQISHNLLQLSISSILFLNSQSIKFPNISQCQMEVQDVPFPSKGKVLCKTILILPTPWVIMSFFNINSMLRNKKNNLTLIIFESNFILTEIQSQIYLIVLKFLKNVMRKVENPMKSKSRESQEI